jgi:hypothetical protein
MGCTRFALPVALIGMTVASFANAGEPAQNATPARNYNSNFNSNSSSTSNQSPRDILRGMTGEWQGQIEVRRDNKVSVSIVSASNRFDKEGNFVSAFSGFAFGRMYDGGTMFQIDRDGSASSYASTQDFGVEGMRGTFEVGQDGSLVAIGQPSGNTRSNMKTIGQVTSMASSNKYSTEWFEIAPNGEKTSLVKMTFERLGRGQQADASELFNSRQFQNWNQKVKIRSQKTAEVTE